MLILKVASILIISRSNRQSFVESNLLGFEKGEKNKETEDDGP